MYLLDASVFIQLAQTDEDPEFSQFLGILDRLFTSARAGSVRAVSQEVLKAVASNELRSWVKRHSSRFTTPDRFSVPLLPMVSAAAAAGHELSASAAFLEGSELYVLAQALANPKGTIVVTCEPHTSQYWKVSVPSACEAVGVKWTRPQEMLRREKADWDFPG